MTLWDNVLKLANKIKKRLKRIPLYVTALVLVGACVIAIGSYALTRSPAKTATTGLKHQPDHSSPAPVVNKSSPAPSPPAVSKIPPLVVAAALPKNLNLYLDPTNNLVVDADAWMTANGTDSGLQRLIAQPVADWFGDWNADVQTDVSGVVQAAAAAGQLPILVAYNIPDRDCGGQSAGGATSASAYSQWISQFAAGIGRYPAIVILEPDAVAEDCYTAATASLLNGAINTLATSTDASVYLDAGNAAWLPAGTMASRLQQSGIAHATGFSLNVSNFQTTSASISYGKQISSLAGGKHFVIDTSRNGNGPTPDNQWCNPAGMALGNLPTVNTNVSLVDAYLWIKIPGESDGACGPDEAGTSAPAAGTWWPQYALTLVRNAGW